MADNTCSGIAGSSPAAGLICALVHIKKFFRPLEVSIAESETGVVGTRLRRL
jgi:hypothetical protein